MYNLIRKKDRNYSYLKKKKIKIERMRKEKRI